MKKNLLIIINPKSGKTKNRKKLPEIIKNFKKIGYKTTVIYTKINYSATRIIEKYGKGMDMLVCCGGDGTLHEVINAIVKFDLHLKLSFIPLGTMNDFAKTIHISQKGLSQIKDMNDFEIVCSDVGQFNKKNFNYVAAFGAFTRVSYGTSQKLKNMFGKLAYFLSGIEQLRKINGYQLNVRFNGKEVEDKFIYGAISNSKSIGGFEWFDKDEIKLDDGRFEMILIKEPKNILHVIKILYLLLKRNYDNSYFIYDKVDKLEINAKEYIKWTLDGELGAVSKKTKVENMNKRIQYIIPK